MRKVFLSALLGSALTFGAELGASALADTAARGDMVAVRQLLAQKMDVNAPQVDGTTALHWAANFDDAEVVKALLAAGANAKVTNRYGITPLSQACENGNAQIIEMLLKAGADVNAPHAEGETPLMTASRTGNPAAIKVLLDNGAQINVAEKWRGQTPLMWAAAEGHTEAVKLLISRGALFDIHSAVFDFTNLRPKAGSVGMNFPRGGFTPLLFAVRQGHMDTVKALVDAGADLNIPEPDGTTALVMAIINFHYDIAAYLLDKGADVNAADIRGRSALYAAVDQKNLDISNRPPAKVEDKNTPETLIRQLIAKGANPNASLIKSLAPRAVLDGGDATMGAGATPFLRAARGGDVDTMKFLLANKANLNATTTAGANAMLIAAGMGWRDGKTHAPDGDSVEAVKYLASLGMPVNVVAGNGETPLHGASGRGSDPVVAALAALGGDLNALDKVGRTPYDMAMGVGAGAGRSPQESTMALLMKLGGKPAPKPEPKPLQ
ncbi:MAG: ankyrin repeat domain-containing protein [Bryobacteraceae bacterium]